MEHALFGQILEQMRSASWQAAIVWLPAAAMFVFGFKLHHEAHPESKEAPAMSPDRTIDNRGGIYNEAPNSGTQTVTTTHVHPTVREPNGLYQNGNKVGHVQGAALGVGGTSVFFQVMTFTAYPEPNTPLEFQDLVIRCDVMPQAQPGEFTGQLSSMAVGITCPIMRRR